MAKVTKSGVERIVDATRFSLAGLRAAWKHEAAFRLECVVVLALVPSAFWVGDTAVERALLIGTCGFVLIVELLNSAVENVVDRIGLDYHELAGRAKDIGSASVFVSLLFAGLVWSLLLWDKLAGA